MTVNSFIYVYIYLSHSLITQSNYLYIYLSTYLSVYLNLSCVCVCVCVCNNPPSQRVDSTRRWVEAEGFPLAPCRVLMWNTTTSPGWGHMWRGISLVDRRTDRQVDMYANIWRERDKRKYLTWLPIRLCDHLNHIAHVTLHPQCIKAH